MNNISPESTLGIKLLAWVEVNKKRLILGGLALGVAIFAGVLIYTYNAEKEARASRALSEIRMPANPTQPVPPGTADQLVKLAEEFRGTMAAPRAVLLSAALLFSDGNYAEAEKRFARVAQEYPASPWLAEAAYGVAMSLDAAGKTNEATAKYEEIRKRYASSEVIDQTRLALARLYESTKPEEAYRLYDEVMKGNPVQYSGLGNEAGMNLEELVKQHPELAKLREPVAPPTLQPQAITLTNRPTLNTNLLRQAMSNAAVRLSNTAPSVRTNIPLMLTPPPRPKPSAPATNRSAAAPAPAAPAPAAK